MRLKVKLKGKSEVYSFPDKTSIKIGRSSACDIILDFDDIENEHAEVSFSGGDYFFKDLGSTHGSFVNGSPLEANKKEVFNSFFPIKLGRSASLSWIDESEVSESNLIFTESSFSKEKTNPSFKTQKKENTSPELRKGKTGSFSFKKEAQNKIKIKIDHNARFKRASYLTIFILLLYLSFPKWKVYLPKTLFADATVTKTDIKSEVKEKKEESVEEKKASLPSGLIFKEKCFTEVEKKFCKLLSFKRDLSFFEGVYVFIDTAYMVLSEEHISSLISSMALTEKEQRSLIAIKRSLNREFKLTEFIQNNYKIADISPQMKLQALIMMEFLVKNYALLLEENKSINNILLTLGKEANNSFTLTESREFSRDSLLKMTEEKRNERLQNIKLFLFSGYDSFYKNSQF